MESSPSQPTNQTPKRQRRKTIISLLSLLVLIGLTVWILYDNATAPYQRMEGKIFGTYYHITYQSSSLYEEEIDLALQEVDESFSTFNPQSIVSQINQNKKVKTNDMFEELFDLAHEVSEATNGAFDITVAPLVNLWGFGFQNSSEVTPAMVDSLLPLVDYQGVTLQKHSLQKRHPAMMLDFSAIAKGYACDIVASLLEQRSVNNYMIEIGGEIRAKGQNPEKKDWTLGIEKPIDDTIPHQSQLQATLSLPQMAVATSGNYRNFYYKDGKKYAHTISPSTGYPVNHQFLSATVVAPTCAMADAYATAFMVLGLEKSQAILKKNTKLSAYFIYIDPQGNYKTWCSPTLNIN